jgi:3-hydroxybutyryl-CoA dehydrogenase
MQVGSVKKTSRGYYSYKEDQQAVSTETQILDSQAQEHISNRILCLLINEAADALRLNIASAADLEIAMTKGVNYPKGLLKWGNDWGIANVLEKLETLQQEYGEERYRPSPLLRQMASSNEQFAI